MGINSLCVWAQAPYPSKPIRVIVPFPAGGGIDTVARQLAPKFSEALGQNFIIDNRAGASGTIGTEMVAKDKTIKKQEMKSSKINY